MTFLITFMTYFSAVVAVGLFIAFVGAMQHPDKYAIMPIHWLLFAAALCFLAARLF